MSSYVRCQGCNGSKQIAPLGFIFKDCKACDGIGYVESYPQDANSKAQSVNSNNLPKIDKRSKAYRDSVK